METRAIFWRIVLLAPALAVFSVFVLWPLVDSFRYSVTNWNGFDPNFDFVGLDNFGRIFTDPEFFNELMELRIGSILPAAWSFMLAARARGLGMAWTTLHLAHEKEISKLLGIPETCTQTALLPVAYFKGKDFQVAKRLPARELTSWDSWGNRR